jgi:hypothetical protein
VTQKCSQVTDFGYPIPCGFRKWLLLLPTVIFYSLNWQKLTKNGFFKGAYLFLP